MENSQQTPMSSVTEEVTKGTEKKSPSLVPLIGLACLITAIVASSAGYYLGSVKNSDKQKTTILTQKPSPEVKATTKPVQINTPAATPDLEPEVTTSKSTTIEGWENKKSSNCNVTFVLPPKEEPYYFPYDENASHSVYDLEGSGRFWDFPRGGSYPNVLSKLPGGSEYLQSSAMFASEKEASGAIKAAVVVSCIKNSSGLSGEQLVGAVRVGFDEYNRKGEFEMEANAYELTEASKQSKWGREVYKLTVKENYGQTENDNSSMLNTYWLFSDQEYIYQVHTHGLSEGQYEETDPKELFLQETISKIKDNLIFE